MIDYAGKNHFEIESMIYDESLIDETTESDPANYITQISIKIKRSKGGQIKTLLLSSYDETT